MQATTSDADVDTARPGAPSRTALWSALLTVYVVWGSTYLAIRYVVASAPPLVSAGLRFLLAAAIVAAALALRGAGTLRVTRAQFAGCAVVGALLLAGGNGLVSIAEQRIPSGLAALIIAAVPLWVVLMRLLARDVPRPATILGVAVGFAGIAVLLRPGAGTSAAGTLTALVASLSWAGGSFLSARLPLPASPFVTTAYEMAAGGAVMIGAGLALGEPFHPGAWSPAAWWSLAYLVVFGSLAAFTAYVWLLGAAPISLTATYAYVNPVVAVALGALLADEQVTASMLVGGAVVVAAVVLVVSAETRPPGRRR